MNEPEFKTPAAVSAFLRKPVKTSVKLPGLLVFKFDLPRADGQCRTIGAYVRTAVETGTEEYGIYYDGHEVACGHIAGGHSLAIKMVKAMARALLVAKGHRARNRANRRAKKAVTDLFPLAKRYPIQLANPPLDKRPTNPEDDE